MFILSLLFAFSSAGVSGKKDDPVVVFHRIMNFEDFFEEGEQGVEPIWVSLYFSRHELGIRGSVLSAECSDEAVSVDIENGRHLYFRSKFPENMDGFCEIKTSKKTYIINYGHENIDFEGSALITSRCPPGSPPDKDCVEVRHVEAPPAAPSPVPPESP